MYILIEKIKIKIKICKSLIIPKIKLKRGVCVYLYIKEEKKKKGDQKREKRKTGQYGKKLEGRGSNGPINCLILQQE